MHEDYELPFAHARSSIKNEARVNSLEIWLILDNKCIRFKTLKQA
jgi:hypothetical protein